MANQEMKICAEEALNGNLEDCARLLFPQEGETMPKLRFSGFEGEWERKLLSECLEISEEKNTDNKFGIEDVLSVSDDYGVVNQIELLGRSYAGKSVSGYKILRPGQIVYTKSPLKAKPYGIVKQNTGEAGIVSVLYAVYNTKEGVAPEYIHYYFDPAWRLNAYMRPLVNKGAKNTMNISDETALTGYIMIPKDIEEQRRIATYLRSLDEQIAIQQQQLERLKKMKQSCLGLLFADNQSITPPLRFKGFKGEWIVIRFSDMAQRISTSGVSDKLPSVEFEDIVSGEGVLNKDVSRKNVVKKGVKFEKHDVLFGKLRPYLKNILYADFNGIAVGDFWVLRASEAVDPYFLYILVSTHQFMSVANISSGSKMPRADWNLVSNSNFAIPSSIDEQRSIASFFRNLDGQINSKSQQVEKLKQVKKACLNQFIA